MADVTVIFDDFDGVQSKVYVTGDDPIAVRGVLVYIRDTITYYDRSRKYGWAAKHGYDDCMVRFFDGRQNTMPIGMIPRVTRYIRTKYGDTVAVKITKSIRQMFTPPFEKITPEELAAYADTLHMYDRKKYLRELDKGNQVTKEQFAMRLFEHQERLALEAINRRRVSLMACTSAGKSLSMMVMARYLMDKENRKVLVIVPNAALVEQLYDNFVDDYGWEDAGDYCTRIHAKSSDKLSKKKIEELKRLSIGEEATLKQITISTWQSLRLKDDSFFKVFTAVIVDEAHSAKGKELRDILAKCTNANNFKIGVSGTLPDAELGDDPANCIDAGYIEGGLGPKEEIVHLKELIAKGILTPVEVKAIFVPYPMKLRPALCGCNYTVERDIITETASRKEVIEMLISGGRITTGQNTVILYNYKDHLHSLVDFLKETHPEFAYHVIEGELDAVERNKISGIIEDGVGNIIVATYGCMKQGVNIRLLHNLVLAEPMKSAYTVVQSIGRVVRKHPEKTLATVFDLVDDASYYTTPRGGGQGTRMYNYMLKHYYNRVKYYSDEDIPIEEVHLDGLYEAPLTPDEIKAKRDKAAQSAAESNEKATKKSGKKGGKVRLDPYYGRSLFTR